MASPYKDKLLKGKGGKGDKDGDKPGEAKVAPPSSLGSLPPPTTVGPDLKMMEMIEARMMERMMEILEKKFAGTPAPKPTPSSAPASAPSPSPAPSSAPAPSFSSSPGPGPSSAMSGDDRLAKVEKMMEAQAHNTQALFESLMSVMPKPGSAKAKKPKKKDIMATVKDAVQFSPTKKKGGESKLEALPAEDSEDEDAGGDDDEDPVVAPSKEERKRITLHVLAEKATYGTFTNWVRYTEWRSKRNMHEAENWAYVLDAMEREGNDVRNDSYEGAVRRLLALKEVDAGSSWAVARALQWQAPQSMLPYDVLKEARKAAQLEEKMQSGSGSSDKKSGGGGGGGGGGGYGKKKKSHNKRSGGGSSGGPGSGSGGSPAAPQK